MLGLNEIWNQGQGISNNLIIVITCGGGHVAWPKDGFFKDGYSYLKQNISQFCLATNNNLT